jgi:hypothetical protein
MRFRIFRRMTDLEERGRTGRLQMRSAFVELSALAFDLGADEEDLDHLHGLFFAGHQRVKEAGIR